LLPSHEATTTRSQRRAQAELKLEVKELGLGMADVTGTTNPALEIAILQAYIQLATADCRMARSEEVLQLLNDYIIEIGNMFRVIPPVHEVVSQNIALF
jgi:hypothetical protein